MLDHTLYNTALFTTWRTSRRLFYTDDARPYTNSPDTAGY